MKIDISAKVLIIGTVGHSEQKKPCSESTRFVPKVREKVLKRFKEPHQFMGKSFVKGNIS